MNRFRSIAAALLLLLVAASAQAAPVESVNVGLRDVIDTVEKSYRALSDVTADFFQRSTLAEKQREMRADGQMFLKLETVSGAASPLVKFRFDYFRPTTQEIVSNGRTLWVYLPENRQVIMSDVSFVFDPFAFNPDVNRASNFLQGLGRISQDFQINFSPQRQDIDGNYILELNPRRSMATIQKLFIVVHRDAVLLYARTRVSRNVTELTPGEFKTALDAQAVSAGGRINRPELAFPVLATTMVDHKGNTSIMEFSNVKTNSRLSDLLFDFNMPAGVQVVRPPEER